MAHPENKLDISSTHFFSFSDLASFSVAPLASKRFAALRFIVFVPSAPTPPPRRSSQRPVAPSESPHVTTRVSSFGQWVAPHLSLFLSREFIISSFAFLFSASESVVTG
ncbi:hypothetical protein HGRIS_011903 [Hohenbuehelia grisea]|uniref:Uncharacterized protein n=1 Tax=Hohenbuehelia grisea TaxID=104357 RepID=A0ABR3JWH7_9AGAR